MLIVIIIVYTMYYVNDLYHVYIQSNSTCTCIDWQNNEN